MNQERIFQVLIGPHTSEKATIIADLSNQYVFKVAIDASKLEVKKSVEQLFKVKVVNVNTLRVKGKVKRNKNGYSTKSTWKKAYVKLEQGHDIDFALAD
ncbi:MAG: 50S ribosomal protein L23 [Halioglobus sp.]|jgi:large subunit ribosomal protein L23|uniref:50S ribosomal protein L23 n=1 Tax=Halioglobus sp. Uisw_031 TaxID=3230977 RepID=UPI003590E5E0